MRFENIIEQISKQLKILYALDLNYGNQTGTISDVLKSFNTQQLEKYLTEFKDNNKLGQFAPDLIDKALVTIASIDNASQQIGQLIDSGLNNIDIGDLQVQIFILTDAAESFIKTLSALNEADIHLDNNASLEPKSQSDDKRESTSESLDTKIEVKERLVENKSPTRNTTFDYPTLLEIADDYRWRVKKELTDLGLINDSFELTDVAVNEQQLKGLAQKVKSIDFEKLKSLWDGLAEHLMFTDSNEGNIFASLYTQTGPHSIDNTVFNPKVHTITIIKKAFSLDYHPTEQQTPHNQACLAAIDVFEKRHQELPNRIIASEISKLIEARAILQMIYDNFEKIKGYDLKKPIDNNLATKVVSQSYQLFNALTQFVEKVKILPRQNILQQTIANLRQKSPKVVDGFAALGFDVVDECLRNRLGASNETEKDGKVYFELTAFHKKLSSNYKQLFPEVKVNDSYISVYEDMAGSDIESSIASKIFNYLLEHPHVTKNEFIDNLIKRKEILSDLLGYVNSSDIIKSSYKGAFYNQINNINYNDEPRITNKKRIEREIATLTNLMVELNTDTLDNIIVNHKAAELELAFNELVKISSIDKDDIEKLYLAINKTEVDSRKLDEKFKKAANLEDAKSVHQEALDLHGAFDEKVKQFKPLVDKLSYIESLINDLTIATKNKQNPAIGYILGKCQSVLKPLRNPQLLNYKEPYKPAINQFYRVIKKLKETRKFIAETGQHYQNEKEKQDLIELAINPVIKDYIKNNFDKLDKLDKPAHALIKKLNELTINPTIDVDTYKAFLAEVDILPEEASILATQIKNSPVIEYKSEPIKSLAIFAFGTEEKGDKLGQKPAQAFKTIIGQFGQYCETPKCILDGPGKLGTDVYKKVQKAVAFIVKEATDHPEVEKIAFVGFSRGGVIGRLLAAHLDSPEFAKKYPAIAARKLKFELFGIDPVSGPVIKGFKAAKEITPNVEECINTYNLDEKRFEMKPQGPSRTQAVDPSVTSIIHIRFPGPHTVGNSIYKDGNRQLHHVPMMTWHLVHNFMTKHGVRFKYDSVPPLVMYDKKIKADKPLNYPQRSIMDEYRYTNANEAEVHKKLLALYADMREHRDEYRRGGKALRSGNDHNEDFVLNPEFFMNQHERELAKLLYPLVFNYFFEQHQPEPPLPHDIKEVVEELNANKGDKWIQQLLNRYGKHYADPNAHLLSINGQQYRIMPGGTYRIEECKFIKPENAKHPELDYLERKVMDTLNVYRRDRLEISRNKHHKLSKALQNEVREILKDNLSEQQKAFNIIELLDNCSFELNPADKSDKKFIDALNKLLVYDEKIKKYINGLNASEDIYLKQMHNTLAKLTAADAIIHGILKIKQSPYGVKLDSSFKDTKSPKVIIDSHTEAMEYFDDNLAILNSNVSKINALLDDFEVVHQSFIDTFSRNNEKYKKALKDIEQQHIAIINKYDSYKQQAEVFKEKVAEFKKQLTEVQSNIQINKEIKNKIKYAGPRPSLWYIIKGLKPNQSLLLNHDEFIIKHKRIIGKSGKGERSKAAFNKILDIVTNDMTEGKLSWRLLDNTVITTWGNNVLTNIPEALSNYRDFNNKIISNIADSLNQISKELFLNISNEELLQLKGYSDPAICPNIYAYSGYFNRIVAYVNDDILSEDNLAARAIVMERWVRVMDACLQAGNFYVAQAINTAFSSTAIYRLDATQKSLSFEAKEILKRSNDLFAPSSNFKNLRAAMADAEHVTVPFIGILQTDLTFAKDGNPNSNMQELEPVIKIFSYLNSVRNNTVTAKDSNTNLATTLKETIAAVAVEKNTDDLRYKQSLKLEGRGAEIAASDFVTKFLGNNNVSIKTRQDNNDSIDNLQIKPESANDDALITIKMEDNEPTEELHVTPDSDLKTSMQQMHNVDKAATDEKLQSEITIKLPGDPGEWLKAYNYAETAGNPGKAAFVQALNQRLQEIKVSYTKLANNELQQAQQDIELLLKAESSTKVKLQYMNAFLNSKRWENITPLKDSYKDTLNSINQALSAIEKQESSDSYNQLFAAPIAQLKTMEGLLIEKQNAILELKTDLQAEHSAYAQTDITIINRVENRAIRQALIENILFLPKDIKSEHIAYFNIDSKNIIANLKQLGVVGLTPELTNKILQAQNELKLIARLQNPALKEYFINAKDPDIFGLTEQYIEQFNQLDNAITYRLLKELKIDPKPIAQLQQHKEPEIDLSKLKPEVAWKVIQHRNMQLNEQELDNELIDDPWHMIEHLNLQLGHAAQLDSKVFAKVFKLYPNMVIKNPETIKEINALLRSKDFNREALEALLDKSGLGDDWLANPITDTTTVESILGRKASCSTWWDVIQLEQKRILLINRLAHPVLRKALLDNPKIAVDDSTKLSSLNTFSGTLAWGAASQMINSVIPGFSLTEEQYDELHKFNIQVELIAEKSLLNKYRGQIAEIKSKFNLNLTEIDTLQRLLNKAERNLVSLGESHVSAFLEINDLKQPFEKLQAMQDELSRATWELSSLFVTAYQKLSSEEQEAVDNILHADIPFDAIERFKNNSILNATLVDKEAFEQLQKIKHLNKQTSRILQHLTLMHIKEFSKNMDVLEQSQKQLLITSAGNTPVHERILALEAFIKDIDYKRLQLPEGTENELGQQYSFLSKQNAAEACELREKLARLAQEVKFKLAEVRLEQELQNEKLKKQEIEKAAIHVSTNTETVTVADKTGLTTHKGTDKIENPLKNLITPPDTNSITSSWVNKKKLDKNTIQYVHRNNLSIVHDKKGVSYYIRNENSKVDEPLRKKENDLCAAWADLLLSQSGKQPVVVGGYDPQLRSEMAKELDKRGIPYTFANNINHLDDLASKKESDNNRLFRPNKK